MNTIKDKIGIVLFFLGVVMVMLFLIRVIEEKPHMVTIEGKQYIRSKEYVGDGHFQIILVPVNNSVGVAKQLNQ